MFIRKLTATDAFLAVDLADVAGHGVARLAPKIPVSYTHLRAHET